MRQCDLNVNAMVLLTSVFLMGDQLDVKFSSNVLDRWLLRTEIGESAGYWELSDQGSRAFLPSGRVGRPPLKIAVLVHVVGDFEVVAQYATAKLPHPTTNIGSNNVEIAISSPDGFATCFRSNEAGSRGDGYGFYLDYADQRDSVFQHFPTTATAGQLAIRRTGNKLTFLQGDVRGSFVELGSLVFGSRPITEVALQALANRTTDGLDVRFERLEIRADKILRLHEPYKPGLNWWLWGPAAAAATVLAAWAIRRWRQS